VGLLPGELSPALEMDRLDLSKLRVGNPDESILAGRDTDAVERGFVGVEREQRGGPIRVGRGSLEEEEDLVGRDLELLDPNALRLESFPMIGREADVKRTPFAVAKREPDFAGIDVEMEGGGRGAEEPLTNVGGSGVEALVESATITFGKGGGDAGSGDGVLSGELVNDSAVPGKPGELSSRGAVGKEGVAKDLVGE
jgi:hypothetical protein